MPRDSMMGRIESAASFVTEVKSIDLPFQIDLVLRDPACLQEIVEQVRHLLGLPLQYFRKRGAFSGDALFDLSRAVAVTIAPSGFRSSCESIARN